MSPSYSEEIEKRYNKLSTAEELQLAERIKKGDKKAENKLICSNLKFVISICRKYQGQGVLLEDLIGAGNIGLIEAARRFDPGRHCGEKFITFAVWYIKHHVFESIMMFKFMYRIPNTYHNDILKYNKIKLSLERRFCRPPTKSELLESMEVDEQRLDVIEDLLDQNKFVSLSDFVSKAKNVTYADVICNEQEDVSKVYDLRERRRSIYKALDNLTPQEKKVIVHYFGLSNIKLSLKELGTQFGITREAVRFIKNRALKKLGALGNNLKEFYEIS